MLYQIYYCQILLGCRSLSRFEKEKENLYKRNYENLFTILSQIGGFSQILLTIFSFICLKYSQIHLGRSLINQSFEFSQTQDSNNQGTLISNPTLHQNKTETLENQGFQNNFKPKPLSPAATPHMKESSFQLQMSQNIQGSPIYAKEDRISLFHHPQQSPSEDSPQKINKKISQNIGKKLSDEKILEDFQKQQEICKNQQTLHFNVFSYMLSFVTQIFKSVRDKRKVVDYGLKAISNNLDVEFIIKKFIEIDKLKRIILNDDQLALFNYIPKPQINYKIHPSQGVVIEKNSLFGNDDNLNDFEKFKKAKHSFINIVEKQKQTKIDQSILNLLDHKHYQILSNKLDQKQSPNLQLSGNQMQTLQPLSPQYQSEMSNVRLVKKIINQDEAEEDSTEDNFDSNKIKQYSTFKKVRNPSQYYSTSNQEKQIYCVLQKKPFLISFYLKNRLKIYSIQDSVQEKL